MISFAVLEVRRYCASQKTKTVSSRCPVKPGLKFLVVAQIIVKWGRTQKFEEIEERSAES